MLRFHTQTGGSTLTAQQPENNIARTTIQALAAILGGTQSLHTNSMDEALSLPSEKAVRVALRTQQIIAFESGVADSVDPLAGSYLVESLTDSLEKMVIQMISKIDEMGGVLEAIDNGFVQSGIQESAYRFQKAVENKSEIIVGVNNFLTDEKVEIERLRVDPAIEAQQVSRLAKLRASRDDNKVNELMAQIETFARSEENLMPLFITCVENEITLGEICGVLRKVWGEYQPPIWG
jgi:methylmalonyl-CoA mutase N-terminal domain/subunit